LGKLRAQIRKSAKEEYVSFFRHEGRYVSKAWASLPDNESAARAVTIRLRNHRWDFLPNVNHFNAVQGQAAPKHGFPDEIRYSDDTIRGAISRHGK
jgi:hypothetical protein